MPIRKSRAIAAICFLLAAGAGIFMFLHLGEWLELDEPLARSKAIVVLGGGVPYRPMEAAALYKAKWADQVWVTRGALRKGDLAMMRLGLQAVPEYETSELILGKLCVPAEAIRVIPDPVENTVEEEKAILRYTGNDPHSLILVTSKFHTRRARVIWDLTGRGRAPLIVRYAPDETYNAARWWSTSGDALATFKELFGILNARAGFPVQPREHD